MFTSVFVLNTNIIFKFYSDGLSWLKFVKFSQLAKSKDFFTHLFFLDVLQWFSSCFRVVYFIIGDFPIGLLDFNFQLYYRLFTLKDLSITNFLVVQVHFGGFPFIVNYQPIIFINLVVAIWSFSLIFLLVNFSQRDVS